MHDDFKNRLTTAILSCPIVYVQHFHNKFVDDVLCEIVNPVSGRALPKLSIEDHVIEFSMGQGRVINFLTKKVDNDYCDYNDVEKLLEAFIFQSTFEQSLVLVLRDITSQLSEQRVQSLLSSFAYKYENGFVDKRKTIVIVSPRPVSELPPTIEKFITVIDLKAPDQSEIMAILDECEVSERNKGEERELKMDLCRTLQGLQLYEIRQILYSSLIRTGMRISAKTKRLALEEKKNIVRKSGIIEVVDANESFDRIGGLDVLKEDLRRKAVIYSHLSEAQNQNVPLPKGILIIGMPGCGKTMIAKSIANEFGVSLLRLDINRLMGKYVGESETNLRLALQTAEAAHPCVLWIDEIEKAFYGTAGDNGDMLVMRLMGHFLTWMQERTTPVFIVATANDVMRPEFMRKGRFDEVYFVDFPNEEEREEILNKCLERYKKDPNSIYDFSGLTLDGVVKKMTGTYGGFSGAEINSIVSMVIERKFVEYIEKRRTLKDKSVAVRVAVTQDDFLEVIKVIADSVMSNQKSEEDPKTHIRNKTNIERIRDMWDTYKFKRATAEKPSKK